MSSQPAPTPRRTWFHSLYWRVAAGFIVLLALMLAAQGAMFIWLAVRTEGGQPPRMLKDVAELLATDLVSALEVNPDLDLRTYARQRLANFHRPAFILFPEGRVVTPPGMQAPPGAIRFGRQRLERAEPAGDEPVEGLRMRRPTAFAPVVFRGRTVAGVIVPPLRGPRRVANEFGPWLASSIATLLIGGTGLAALLLFRPAQARLRALEAAATRLGAGDRTARAPEEGSDEISDVARAFNRMANDLFARQDELARSDRMRRQLLADVSHELRTPLTAIRGYAETLALPRFAPATEDGRAAVTVIQEEVERIERVVADLLDLARYDAAAFELSIQLVQTADLFARIEARHGPAARAADVRLERQIEAGAGETCGDPLRLEQALQNLVANALRYTPPGGEVMLRAERRGERLVLQVRDTGTGITPEHLPYVFDRFYKMDASRSHQGSGLGLSIVRAIAERHGGSVRAESSPGVQTVFEIELPGAPRSDVSGGGEKV